MITLFKNIEIHINILVVSWFFQLFLHFLLHWIFNDVFYQVVMQFVKRLVSSQYATSLCHLHTTVGLYLL